MIIFKEEREIGEINFNSIVYLTFYIQNISISAFNECKIIERVCPLFVSETGLVLLAPLISL